MKSVAMLKGTQEKYCPNTTVFTQSYQNYNAVGRKEISIKQNKASKTKQSNYTKLKSSKSYYYPSDYIIGMELAEKIGIGSGIWYVS